MERNVLYPVRSPIRSTQPVPVGTWITICMTS